jgi:hypothetical protein
MFDHNDLAALIRAGHPLLVVETSEEALVVDAFRHVIGLTWRPLWKWSLTRGLERLDMDLPEEGPPQGTDASQALRSIHGNSERAIYLLLDFHPFLRYAMNLRLLREVCMRKGTAAHTLVMIAPKVELPDELRAFATTLEARLPDEEKLKALVREEAFAYSRENAGRRVEIDAAALRAIVRNLRGLKLADARKVIRQIVHNDGAICPADLPEVAQAKFRLLNGDGLLHFEYEVHDPDQIAGMARLKRWIELRRPAFLGEADAAKLDPPKGILLLGVQGAGKSMAARAVAGSFRVPLLRMDFGALYHKYHGETERNLREALNSAEAMAPCVLWIDEIEKGLAQSDSDGGVSRRVLGTVLTWMAERKAPIFLFATANAVHELPPELLRKGRFDEIFFVDLPTAGVRAEIFRIHLARRALGPGDFDLEALAAASAGFSGAEIEQAVVSGLYAAYAAGRRLDTGMLLDELAATRPLSVIMAEKIQALRDWASSRTVPAD